MESPEWFFISNGNSRAAAADLLQRINCWREGVQACTSPDPTSQSSQFPLPCENWPLSLATRPRNSRRKPYARPPNSPRHQRHPHMDVSDLHGEPMVFFGPRQVVRVAPEVARDHCEMSGHSIKDGLDLPHPEHNPLITCHPDVLEEEYCRLASIFDKLNIERSRAELRWLQTSSTEAMASIMDFGSNIRRVVDAVQYVITYSQNFGWDIDFEALAYGGVQPQTTRVLPSRVRELVCSAGISNNQDSNGEWHLYPAA